MSDSLERELLAAARRGYEPALDAEARVKARVMAALAVTSASGVARPPAAPSATTASGTTASLVAGGVAVVAIAIAIAIALVRGSTPDAPRLAPPATEIVPALPSQPREPAEPTEPTEPTEPAEPAEPGEIAIAPRSAPLERAPHERSSAECRSRPPVDRATELGSEPARSEPARSEASTTEPPATEEDPLAAELALLERADAAVRAGDGSGALALLEAHRARFARGVLAAERETLAVEALCADGRVEEARTRAQQLLASSPSSPHARRLRASCGAP